MDIQNRAKIYEAELRENLADELELRFGVDIAGATAQQLYRAITRALVRILNREHINFKNRAEERDAKRVYYMSVEFLMGRSMRNSLYNLGLEEAVSAIAKEAGLTIGEIYDREPDAGLGNGGLGRLAACYLDALTGEGVPATGFSIRYEYGIFRQKITDGWQVELPDLWLENGDMWMLPKVDEAVKVRMGGHIEESNEGGSYSFTYRDYTEITAVPWDMYIAGYRNEAVNLLRLWSARTENEIDMALFARGEYARAVEQKNMTEAISKVLYPADDHWEGKVLRIKQQYFLVSASLQQITREHLEKYGTLDNLAEKAAVHINDTHPAMCVPELMRILMDEHGYPWERAFEITRATLAYTNHTVMSEALERWPVELFENQLPRIYKIVVEINRRLMLDLGAKGVRDAGKLDYMAVCNSHEVRMANLCLASVHAVNGVSALHTKILRERVFRDYAAYRPEIFLNITNGIAHRRWLCQANPGLTALLTESIGPGFETDASLLAGLRAFRGDKAFLERLGKIKRENKLRLADYLRREAGVSVDPSSLFDVQVKRLHEYKRQLLNVLHILSLYHYLKSHPDADIPPRTFLFGAKASAAYYTAKRIIKLICSVADMIAADPAVRDKIKVVFVENYGVTLAEIIIPAADLSEQISIAGKEASGTGNMKLMINGALTIGTLDGANIEIKENAGEDNIFIFGMTSEQVEEQWRRGYAPGRFIDASPALKAAIEHMKDGIGGESFADIAGNLVHGNGGVPDSYMNCADFESYRACQSRVSEVWRNREAWNAMSLENIAGAGFFSADRAVGEYAEKIWNTPPVK